MLFSYVDADFYVSLQLFIEIYSVYVLIFVINLESRTYEKTVVAVPVIRTGICMLE